MEKTVYILGAGFSVEAGIPQQKRIMSGIFSLDTDELSDYRYVFHDFRKEFDSLLRNNFRLSKEDYATFPLEHVFSVIDECISEQVNFWKYSYADLLSLRRKISALEVILIKHEADKGNSDYIDAFAGYLVDIRKRKQRSDPFAIITTNWDILLDKALKSKITDKETIDYALPFISYSDEEDILFPLLAMGMGRYNVKLIKIHGSMNWLYCKNCQSLYTTFKDEIALHTFISQPICRKCTEQYGNEVNSELVSNLMMPTFYKDLSHGRFNDVWSQAALEISESRHMAFIGYSFSEADLRFLNLLFRKVHKNAMIEIISKRKDAKDLLNDAKYRNLFGRREIVYHNEGAKHYIEDLIAGHKTY